jgi:hypothetical protein
MSEKEPVKILMKPKLQLFKTRENDTRMEWQTNSDSGAWLLVDIQ